MVCFKRTRFLNIENNPKNRFLKKIVCLLILISWLFGFIFGGKLFSFSLYNVHIVMFRL